MQERRLGIAPTGASMFGQWGPDTAANHMLSSHMQAHVSDFWIQIWGETYLAESHLPSKIHGSDSEKKKHTEQAVQQWFKKLRGKKEKILEKSNIN